MDDHTGQRETSTQKLFKVGGRNWRSVRGNIRADLGRIKSRFRPLHEAGFEPVELTLRFFGQTPNPLSNLAQLAETYGFGQRSAWTLEARILGVLAHVGALDEAIELPLRAETYAQVFGRAVAAVGDYMKVPPNVRERVLIREFGLADALRCLPAKLPLCEALGLAAVCSDKALLARLRAGENLTAAEVALRLRYGFDQEVGMFRTYKEVAVSMNARFRTVRADIEHSLAALGVQPL